MLCWNTVSDPLKRYLLRLMQADELRDFRLVGGTALSLYWGHRMSVDIDLFTDAQYGAVDFNAIENFLKENFAYVDGEFGANPGMGRSYLIGDDQDNAVKLDIYYAMDPFAEPPVEMDGVRMASTGEIVAMKVDVVSRGARKKDFWDLHQALEHYTVAGMMALHRRRFEWTHDEMLIRRNFIDFAEADDDLEPLCLLGKQWVFIKEDIEAELNKPSAD
jgi:predicted nucleotidyltransferase